MPKVIKPLTESQIKKTKPEQGNTITLRDGNGLMLRVTGSGAKTWYFSYYRPISKKKTNLKLGQYPGISLLDAREIAVSYRVLVDKSIDPSPVLTNEEKLKAKKLDFNAVFKKWLHVKSSKVTPDYLDDIQAMYSNHLEQKIGHIPIDQITAPEIIESMQSLVEQGKLETVRRLCQRANEVMWYGINSGLISFNPIENVKETFQAPDRRNLPTIKPEELPDLMHKVREANISKITRYLLMFQLHTAVRPATASNAKWEDIDLENKIWIIPPEDLKGKDSEFKQPLSKQVIKILTTLKKISGTEKYIFPGIKKGQPLNSQTVNNALKRMGFNKKLVSHGFRALASTTLNELGRDYDLIEKSLQHTEKNSVRKAYNRAEYVERRRELMQEWSDIITQAQIDSLEL